ncbi:hypothetical protein HGRIS_005008 [Hohenbuehelia grisea]|uniref:C2H2-type domain-containing protein n=1 Tax=Hohenbuehelia grisea TaxID=104357 RepID=A0ABR3JEM3_9AGAR
MLPQIAPQLDIPKYIADYTNNTNRPRALYDELNTISPSHSVSPLDEDNPSPLTPPPTADNNPFYPLKSNELYENSYSSYNQQSSGNYSFGPATSLRNPYLSDSPSPVDVHSNAAPQDHFSHASFNPNASPSQLNSLLDQRLAPRSYQHFPYAGPSPYSHPLHRSGSLRDLRMPFGSHLEPLNTNGLDEPLSPLNPNFSGLAPNGLPYSPVDTDSYGPSPPNTGTSSSSAPMTLSLTQGPTHPLAGSGMGSSPTETNSKTYSFVALPGNAVKKRPRRRYDEIERLYQCSWPDCAKAYGTLNHLNAHVTMQKHGSKRSPNEFKELRKQWRKAKKEAEAAAAQHSRRANHGHGLSSVSRDSGLFDYPNPSHSLPSHSHSHSHSHVRHPSLPGLNGLPSSISVPQMVGQDTRYALNMPLEDIRFPPDEHDDQGLNAYGLTARQRYGSAPGSLPASWSSSMRESTTSSGMQQQQQQNPFGLNLSNAGMMSSNGPLSMNRLPADSTLLTPLPGYEPPSMLAPLPGGDLSVSSTSTFQQPGGEANNAVPNGANGGQGYDVYDEDAGTRPSTGHASLGASGDEY